MAITILPLYANAMGASTTMVGFVTSSFAITALLIRPFAGPAFDSFSRKKLLLISQAIICISFFLFGIVETLPLLVAVRMLHGIGAGCASSLGLALVSEYLPPNKFASGISVYTLTQSAAQVIGPAAGIFLVNSIGFSPTYFLASSLLFIAMIGIIFIKEPARKYLPYQLKLSRMFAKETISQAIALLLISIAFSCAGSYVVLYGYERGVADMGLYFIVYAGCLLGTRPVFGELADKLSTPRMLVVGLACFMMSYVLLSRASDLAGFLLAAVFGSAGFGACAPLLQSLALSSVPIERRGAASNTTFTGLDIGNLAGPVLGGLSVEMLLPVVGSQANAYAGMWLVLLIPIALAMLFVISWIVKAAKQNIV